MDIQASGRTGATDPEYNLISVLYHQLQQAETCEQYIQDAERAGDEALVEFFRSCQAQARTTCEQAKELLREHFSRVGGASTHAHEDELADEASKLSFPASDVPAY